MRDAALPISLDYHASGIRVNEEATMTGLGWTLSAGGAITRTVNGEDDFKSNGGQVYFNPSVPAFPVVPINGPSDEAQLLTKTNWFQEGCTLEYYSPATNTVVPVDLSSVMNTGVAVPIDYQPDTYSFNFLGYSGKFVLNRNYEAILVNQQKIKIVYNPTAATWTVTTIDGATYSFDQAEENTDGYYSAGIPIKTAWYLTNIRSPKGESITLTYVKDSQLMASEFSISEVKTAATYNISGFPTTPCPAGPNTGAVYDQRRSYKILTLTEINYKTGKVQFVTDQVREDVTWGRRLTAVKIYRRLTGGGTEAVPFKTVAFNYGYFVGSGTTPNPPIPTGGMNPSLLSKRLKLLSMSEQAPNETAKVTALDYYEGNANNNYADIPTKISFARDYHGYYNGRTQNASLIPNFSVLYLYPTPYFYPSGGSDREANSDVSLVQKMTLKRILYPTGGATEFQYETHDYDPENSNQRDYSIQRNTSDLVPITVQVPASNASQSGSINLTQGFGTGVYGKTVIVDINLGIRFTDQYRAENGRKGLVASNGDIALIFSYPGGADFQTIDLVDYMYRSNSQSNVQVIQYKVCQAFVNQIINWRIYIKPSVQNLDNITGTFKWTDKGTTSATVPLLYAGGLRIKKIIENDGVSNSKIRSFNYHYQENKNGTGLKEYSYGRRMAKPLHMVYDYSYNTTETIVGRVTESCANLLFNSNSYTPLTAGPVVAYDQVTVLYGENGENGKSVFKYENKSDAILEYSYRRAAGVPTLSSNRNGLLMSQTDYQKISSTDYQVVKEVNNSYLSVNRQIYLGSRRELLPSTYALTYANNCGISQTVYPAVDAEWVQLKTTEEKVCGSSDAGCTATTTTYEYNALNYLTAKVTKSTSRDNVFATTTYTYPLDYQRTADASIASLQDNFVLNSVIEEKQLYAGNVVGGKITYYDAIGQPKDIRLLETASPLPDWTFNGTTIIPAGKPYVSRITMTYDAANNLITSTPSDGVPTSYVWGYQSTLPVAEIRNASYGQVTGTGADLASVNTTYPTGDVVRAAIQTVRSGLSGALVSTVTYDPAFGAKSTSNPANIVTYQEYDGHGRLSLIRDNNQQKVKEYAYSYQGAGIVINQAPTTSAALVNQYAPLSQPFTYVLPANLFVDPEGQALTYSISGLPVGFSYANGTVSGSSATAGTSFVTLTATDPGGLSTSVSFFLTVSYCNGADLRIVTGTYSPPTAVNINAINIMETDTVQPVVVNPSASLTLKAVTTIKLKPGFVVKPGASFRAYNGPCN
ncbi:putative Ig domain-containing protein [Fibrella aquatilis]|uniref:Dystroglycan-type cadherin-like domain-containing protein n=1 Tax=Fibrella aquatilis TaxID=2817059 RepID=A0A939K0E3_9BACT|nr:putative Ig domain-containing protein [Fibrella aquatilis]MBO0934104.1 hypothetical protein [Fibrella aquatilis]